MFLLWAQDLIITNQVRSTEIFLNYEYGCARKFDVLIRQCMVTARRRNNSSKLLARLSCEC